MQKHLWQQKIHNAYFYTYMMTSLRVVDLKLSRAFKLETLKFFRMVEVYKYHMRVHDFTPSHSIDGQHKTQRNMFYANDNISSELFQEQKIF